MKIIEYGHIKPKIVKCNHCGAILEYVQKDLKETYFRPRHERILCLVCPVCGLDIPSDNDGNKFIIDT